jgi:hypothetical protein
MSFKLNIFIKLVYQFVYKILFDPNNNNKSFKNFFIDLTKLN